jgi:hypothetical protein
MAAPPDAAKNCRTSVEMIEKYYGRHLKNTIDAAAVIVRKAPPKPLKKHHRAAMADHYPAWLKIIAPL